VVQGGGTVRSFPIDTHGESVQVLFWAKDVGKKSIIAKIEVLQGPNNYKQPYDLHLGGGSQPYHAVFATPGSGVTLRIKSKKNVADRKFEVVVAPYEIGEDPASVTSDGGWYG
jgi:hypothetical protein